MTGASWGVVITLAAIATLVLWSPRLAGRDTDPDHPWLLTVLLVVALGVGDASVAYALLGVAALVHADRARAYSLTAAIPLALSAVATMVAAVALRSEAALVAYLASLTAIVLRAGVVPFHVGVAQLCERAPAVQTQQLATLLALVVAHLRFADHIPLAYDLAPLLVRYGAAMTLIPALTALVQRELRGFYRAASVMHGGMLLAAIGAAGRGHTTAALMLTVTIATAMGGVGVMLEALEARVGAVSLSGPGGRVQAFPRLAAAFLVFAGAGVAMPGTAGFIADDLLLHALWEESVVGTLTVILGSAVLAVASLMAYSKVFLGRAMPSLAPDLVARERWAVVGLVLVLVWLGVLPGTLLEPADPFLRATGDAAAH
jgi:NADH:ubiquinone oxidoreductase subunit 4 (subunit M)